MERILLPYTSLASEMMAKFLKCLLLCGIKARVGIHKTS